MATHQDLALKRYTNFLRDVIEPAVFPQAVSLTVEAHQITDPRAPLPSPRDALDLAYVPVAPGWRWGPVWSTCWFRVRGKVPAEFAGCAVSLRFGCGTEGMLWSRSGETFTPVQGLDYNRDAVPLFPSARGGEDVLLHIEAACNHPFGVLSFEWDDPEAHHRWSGPTPGRLERCELAVYDAAVRELAWRYSFAASLLKELPTDSPRAKDLHHALQRATNVIDDGRVSATAHAALDVLGEALGRRAGGSASRCVATGHAHIDTAWLWPIRETRRKILRSWSNVLGLMDRFPKFTFLCSQAQQYAWAAEDAPEMFERIKARVAEGRWEPGGGMWVEPDVNVPSGESLIRQCLKGDRAWRGWFGEKGRQRHLYLPDTFGFTAALPQIMRLAGLDTFITNKLHWNQFNPWPHAVWSWRGLDGSEVLGHNTPGKDYNAVNTPMELRRAESTLAKVDGHCDLWLQPFGYGDGGGGPTDRSIRFAEFAADCDGVPRVEMGTASGFCDRLHERVRQDLARGKPLPTWSGEMAIELHRGTLTTQAWLKRAMRRAEDALKVAEMVAAVGPTGATAPEPGTLATLDEAWKITLLNQFHDILPGSSIGWVYEDSRRDMAKVRELADSLASTGLERWANALRGSSLGAGPIVMNPCSHEREGVVDLPTGPAFVRGVPGLGAALVDAGGGIGVGIGVGGVAPVEVRGGTMSNGLIEATIDQRGHVSSLGLFGLSREAVAPGRVMNELVVYEDRPMMWDAWDIDWYHEEKPITAGGATLSWKVVESSPARAVIEVSRTLGERSKVTHAYVLEAGSPMLVVRTTIDWQEDHRLLRALFPTDVLSETFTTEVQFGQVQRPTHRNTPWDQARFEVLGHRWIDISEPGFGVAILNDGKYGHSCVGGVLGMSLLRSPKHPDPAADRGRHEITYAIMPHQGDWREAGVDLRAAELNEPMRVLTPKAEGGSAKASTARSWGAVRAKAEGSAFPVVSCVKPADDGQGIIVRVHEGRGGRGRIALEWGFPVASVRAVDILERPLTPDRPRVDRLDHEGQVTRLDLRPYQIVTLLLTT